MSQPPSPYGPPESRPPTPYGSAPYGGAGAPAYVLPVDHPQAMTVLVLGVLGLVVCGVIAPFAWVMGNRVVREIDASGGRVGGRSGANTGRILGIVGTVVLVVSIVFGLGVLAIVAISVATSSTT